MTLESEKLIPTSGSQNKLHTSLIEIVFIHMCYIDSFLGASTEGGSICGWIIKLFDDVVGWAAKNSSILHCHQQRLNM